MTNFTHKMVSIEFQIHSPRKITYITYSYIRHIYKIKVQLRFFLIKIKKILFPFGLFYKSQTFFLISHRFSPITSCYFHHCFGIISQEVQFSPTVKYSKGCDRNIYIYNFIHLYIFKTFKNFGRIHFRVSYVFRFFTKNYFCIKVCF